jgi:hypothetical protein
MSRKEEVRPDSLNRSGKVDRVPIHGAKNILTVEGQEPGFHYCWVADAPLHSYSYIDRFQRAGYEFVTHGVVVGDRRIDAAPGIGAKITIPGGNGVTLHLMRLPMELYDSDMADFHKKIDQMEQTMYETEAAAPGRYGKIGREKING